MKKILLVFISIFCIYFKALPQGSTCAQIQQYCGGNAQFQAPITGTAATGPAYGCLITQPNPSWLQFKATSNGTINLAITSASSTSDLDFICWGPFNSLTNVCTSLDTSKIIDCSYATGTADLCNITSAVNGKYYILMVTNYSGVAGIINLSQTGTATVSCACVSSTVPTPANPTSNSPQCSGSGVTITRSGTPAAGITWYWQDINPNGSNKLLGSGATYNATLTGSYYIRAFNDTGNCWSSGSGSTAISVNVPPAAGTISGNANFCINSTNNSYSIPQLSGTVNYHWTFPAGATITSNPDSNAVLVNFSGSAVSGNVSVYASNGCGNGTSSAKAITATTTLPVAAGTVTGTATVCQGQTAVTYSVPAITGATNYIWTLPTGATITAGAGTASITVSYAASATSGIIKVNGQNVCGNGTSSANYNITVNSLPAAATTVSGSGTVCQGQTNVTYSTTAISGATSYTWTLPTGASITTGSGTNSIIVSYATTATSGSVTVKGTNACGNGTVSTSFPVTVNPLPAAAGTMAGAVNVCVNSNNVTYSIPVIANTLNYNWSLPTGFTIVSNPDSNVIIVNISGSAVSGNVIVYGSNACGNGTSVTKVVTVSPTVPGVAGAISGSNSVCQSQTAVTYSVTAITNAYSYQWIIPSGMTISAGSGTNSITATFAVNATSGILKVFAQNACGYSDTSSLSINVNPTPSSAGAINGTDTLCSNTNGVQYIVGTINGASNYIWTIPSGASIIGNQNNDTVIVDYSASAITGNITVKGQSAAGCNGAISILSIVIPGSTQTNIFSQGFNALTYPTGWAEVDASAYLSSVTSSTLPTASPAEGTYFIKFNSYTAASGVTATLKQTTPFSTTGRSNVNVNFSWYEYSALSGSNDNMAVQYSLDGITWTTVTTYSRYNAISGWKNKSCVLPAAVNNQASVYIAFFFTSASGYSCYLDNVVVTATGANIVASASASAICTGTSTVLSAAGGSVYYQWQQSTDNIVFSNVTNGTGGTTSTYTTANLTATTYFKCLSSCTNSNTITISVSPVVPAVASTITGSTSVCQGTTGVTYTVPAISGATTYIWTVPTGATITAGSGTNSITVNYSATAASGNVSVYGQNVCGNGTVRTLAITVKVTPAAAGVISGVTAQCYNASNVIYSVPAITNAASYTWTVPAGTNIISGSGTNSITVIFGSTAGNISVYGVSSTGCNGIASSLAITLSAATPAATVSSAATLISCSSFSANWTATSGATNYYLDVATNSTFTSLVAGYSNLTLGNVLTKSVTGLSGSTTYYYRVRASNACGTGLNSSLQNTITSAGPCYCVPANSSTGCAGMIDSVAITGTTLKNLSACLSNSGTSYSSYPASGATTTTLTVGSTYSLRVRTTTAQIISFWIDYNQNGTFDASEWTQVTTSSTANVTSAVNFTIPAGAVNGLTGLRIRSRATGNINGAVDACTQFGSGEAEDYFISIASGVNSNMAFSSTTATQASTATENVGAIKAAILRCQIVTTGTLSPLTATTFNFNTTGTSNVANIKNAKLYYTSTSATFATTTQVGGVVLNPNGSFSINANRVLASGNNYFWLTYDVDCNSANNNVLDAQFTAVNVVTSRTPVVTNPGGTRTISAILITTSNTSASCGNNNGTATATVTGGNGSYVYNWSNGSTTNQSDSLSAGQYFLQVFDALNCSNSTIVNINSTNGPALSNTVVNATCNGGTNGAISTNATGGTAPYTYLWNTGATTSAISNVTAGSYDLTLTDGANCQIVQTITVNQPSPIAISFNINDVACGSNQGSIKANVSGGTGSTYTYLWSANTGSQTTDSVFNLTAGLYTLTVTDAASCSSVGNAAIVNSQGAGFTVSFNNILADGCLITPSGAATAVVTGGTGTISYNWNNGITTANIAGVDAGTYYVTVTDAGNSCTVTQSVNIPSVIGTYQPQICLVTVDTTTMTNQVIWEKPVQNGIQSFKIYREGSVPNAYLSIATVPYNSLSLFTDSVANPAVRAWRYKISAIDSCNIETPLSNNHKTIHLAQNAGLGGVVNLSWDYYEGFSYTTFYIWRDDPSTGWVVIDSLPNTLTTYTDIAPPSAAARYMIEVKAPYTCSPTARTTASTVNTTRSNTKDNYRVTNVRKTIINDFNLYPNPANESVNISLNSDVIITNIKVFDATGRLVKLLNISGKNNTAQINITTLSPGVYILEANTNIGPVRKSFVKE